MLSDNIILEKKITFTNDVIITDGFWGSGKSLLSPIISGMKDVEKSKLEFIYEYIAALNFLKKISNDATFWLLNNHSGVSQYNNLISREVNLRWNDDTGIGYNPGILKYLFRLFYVDKSDDNLVEKINMQNIALNLMTHNSILSIDPILDTFGARLKFIEIVRHPVYLVKYWETYLAKYNSKREFTISFNHKEKRMPWFIKGYEEEFLKLKSVDQSILMIIKTYEWLKKILANKNLNNENFLLLSFEDIVLSTNDTMKRIEAFLNRKHSKKLNSLLKRQKIPRKSLTSGRSKAIHGWKNTGAKSDEEIYAEQIAYINKNGSKKYIKGLSETINWYNTNFPSKLSNLQ